jgi:hypothetical protein
LFSSIARAANLVSSASNIRVFVRLAASQIHNNPAQASVASPTAWERPELARLPSMVRPCRESGTASLRHHPSVPQNPQGSADTVAGPGDSQLLILQIS